MDGEIDSLTQVTTATSGNPSDSDHYLPTTFGAGGRGSQLVEPGFRAPVFSGPDPAIVPSSSSSPFSTPSGAASFSDLAKSNSSYSSNLGIASTLNDYGPVPNYLPPLPSEPPPRLVQPQTNSVSSHASLTVPAPNYTGPSPPSGFVVHPPIQSSHQHRTINLPHLPTTTSSTITLHPPLYAQTTTSTLHHQPPTSSTLSSLPHQSNSIRQPPSGSISAPRLRNNDDAPIYSPPPPSRSPPLDQLMSSGGANIATTSNANSDGPLGRIPKKLNNVVRDEYDDMDMIDLLTVYRSTTQRRLFVIRRREDLEKSINDRMRNCQGKNIELDSKFRELKDSQRKTKDELDEVNATIKKIKHKLSSKYNYHVEETSTRPQPPVARPTNFLNRPPRVRMSTSTRAAYSPTGPPLPPPPSARTRQIESPGASRKRLLLKLNTDCNVWCKLCDIHFDSFKEYCEHLHKREHMRNMKRTDPPWRRNKESLNMLETYEMLKSICAMASKDCEDFSMKVYDDVLNTNMENRNVKLKELGKERDRKNFRDNDPLFDIKGYQNIIPITGFFCQLCDSAFCDATAIEQHVKGESHNLKHAVAVATDAASERTFRQMLDKSHRKQFPDEYHQSASKSIHNDSSRPLPATGSSSSNRTGPASARTGAQPIQKYKKPTSHIVDQHDVIKDKFENRPKPKRPIAGNNAESDADSSDETAPKRKTNNVGVNGKRIMTKLRSESPEIEASSPPPPRPLAPPPPAAAAEVAAPKRRDQLPEIVPLGGKRAESMLTKLKVKPRKPPSPKKTLNRPNSDDDEEEEDVEVEEEEIEVKKSLTKKRKKTSKKAYFSSDSSTDETDEVHVLDEYLVNSGDPSSPWPDLNLKITGNAHWNLLKDPRLAKEPRVVLNRINIEDYKDWLMDSSTYWTRIMQLMTKKEGELDEFKKYLRTKPVVTKKTYFDAGGEILPVQIDDEDKTDDSDDDKSNLRRLIGNLEAGGSKEKEKEEESPSKKGAGSSRNETANDDKDVDVLSNESDTDPNFQMSLLENFFCETKDTNNRN